MSDNSKNPVTVIFVYLSEAVVAFFLFPPHPAITFTYTTSLFRGARIVGLFIGLLVGVCLTGKSLRIQPKKKAFSVIAIGVLLFGILTGSYFDFLKDAENHFYTTLSLFFGVNFISGVILFLISLPLAILVGKFKIHGNSGPPQT